MNSSTAQFISMYNSDPQHQRLGQQFVNRFIKHPWPELFYCTDNDKAIALIDDWLTVYQYFNELPQQLPSYPC